MASAPLVDRSACRPAVSVWVVPAAPGPPLADRLSGLVLVAPVGLVLGTLDRHGPVQPTRRRLGRVALVGRLRVPRGHAWHALQAAGLRTTLPGRGGRHKLLTHATNTSSRSTNNHGRDRHRLGGAPRALHSMQGSRLCVGSAGEAVCSQRVARVYVVYDSCPPPSLNVVFCVAHTLGHAFYQPRFHWVQGRRHLEAHRPLGGTRCARRRRAVLFRLHRRPGTPAPCLHSYLQPSNDSFPLHHRPLYPWRRHHLNHHRVVHLP